MGRRQRATDAQIREALTATNGMVSLAAARLGIAPRTLYARLERVPSLREALSDERERMLDIAENKLFEQIQAGNYRAIAFYLRTIGRSRGYIERQEISGPAGRPLQIDVYDYHAAAAALAPGPADDRGEPEGS